MDKLFFKWLQDNDLWEYFHKNKDIQEQIRLDFERDSSGRLDRFVDWLALDPEGAEKAYPALTRKIKDRIAGLPPHEEALLLHSISQNFPFWVQKFDTMLGPSKLKFAESQIELLALASQRADSEEEVVRSAFKKVEDEIVFQLDFWNDKKTSLQPRQEHVKANADPTQKIISRLFCDVDEKGWEYVFRDKKDYESFSNRLVHFFNTGEAGKNTNLISTRPKSKTRFASLLGDIYRELGQNRLKQDAAFFATVRQIDQFSKMSDTDLYKALTR